MILIPFCLQMFEWILFYIGTMEIHGLSQKKKYNASSDSFALAFEKKDRKWKEIFTLSPSSDVKLLPRSTELQLGSTMARRKHYSDSDVGLMSFKIQRILHKGEIFS